MTEIDKRRKLPGGQHLWQGYLPGRQSVGEAVRDYPYKSFQKLISEGNGLINSSPVEAPSPVKKMTEEERERIWWTYKGKLGLSGDDWVEHMEYSISLNLPYDASPGERRRVSKLKTEDLIRRMERKDRNPEKVQEWLGTETYDWYPPETVSRKARFPKDLSTLNKLMLSTRGIGHNIVQGLDNRINMDKLRKRQFPNWYDTRGLLDAIWD